MLKLYYHLPFNQIEKYLILTDYDRLFQSILSYLHGEETNGSLLRFSTHICLFLYEQNHSQNFQEKTLLEVLTTYIDHLIELEFKDLVCYCISKLPITHQCKIEGWKFLERIHCDLLANIMVVFLETLANRQEKEYYLKQGFTHKIDIC